MNIDVITYAFMYFKKTPPPKKTHIIVQDETELMHPTTQILYIQQTEP